MIFQRFSPAPALASLVECYWHLRGEAADLAGLERILPDGCSELIFNFGAPFRAVRDGVPHAQPQAILVGQITRFLLLEPAGAADIVAARFTPAGAAAFFPFALAEVTDRQAALTELGPPWAGLDERLHAARTTAARVRLLETALLAQQRGAGLARVLHAVRRLRATHGQLRVGALAEELALSPRQLERDFTRAVGLTPKQFARLARFQRIFRAFDAGDTRWADVAVDCGFSDQAHLVNEFRALSGLPPREYFRHATAMGTAFVG